MKVIDKDEAISLLKQVVQIRGEDYVYERVPSGMGSSCFYSRNGEPSCGVGYAIFLASPEAFAQVEKIEKDSESSFPASDFSETYDDKEPEDWVKPEREESEVANVDIRFTAIAADIMSEFQSEQDNGETYRTALRHALRIAGVPDA